MDIQALDKVFKAYDLRGIVPEQLNPEFAYLFGRAFVATMGVGEVAVGRDMRVSSVALTEALIRGITDAGAHVVDLGMIPTDMLCFVCGKFSYESGIVVTASHNPAQWNGFKGCLRGGVAISYDSGFSQVKETMKSWAEELPEASQEKGSITAKDHMDDWVAHVLSFIDISKITQKKLVVDAGNGMAGEVVRRVFAKIPQIELIPMYFEPDGTFPNHIANPIEEENLIDLKGKMEQEEADLGIAFDADADRMAMVDEAYMTLNGTLTTAILAQSFLKKTPGGTILYNAICGRIVPETIEKYGGKGIRVRVGHSIIKDAMKEHHALMGGEVSGHFFFQDNYNADSGIIAALLMLERICESGEQLVQLRVPFERYVSSSELKFHIDDVPAVLARVRAEFANYKQDELDGISIYDTDWWANVRASNTEPVVKLSIEALTMDLLQEKKALFSKILTA